MASVSRKLPPLPSAVPARIFSSAKPALERGDNYGAYRSLIERTVDVFGDEVKASRWLSSPSADLGGRIPLEVVQPEGYRADLLEPIFLRIEHGIDF